MAAVIRADVIWLATDPLDMRAGNDTILVRVVKVFGAGRLLHVDLFANRHSTRMNVLVYDSFGICPLPEQERIRQRSWRLA
ncbi:IS66 family insertion sequence element accessory protein TnpB [Paraburkholderia aspalathi]|uniref:IS66 family insertion sequence element accessory protein TnpB n=1 Tax=Paraburkholderia aspalathi TaxID=1324617 RepID=UPI0038B9C211